MSDSVLTWMQHNEKRFQKRDRQEITTATTALSSPQVKLRKLSPKLQNPQISMDNFLEPVTENGLSPKIEPPLFDEEFSLADFRSLTQQWKEDNLIAS
ncbi:MAG: hypothetical protein E4G98_00635 [Promethearchaeota archaeon]|nr:MAG: hypothetical protein E4G98_00635 [Candidatus Lokiarchaeota archaeon]